MVISKRHTGTIIALPVAAFACARDLHSIFKPRLTVETELEMSMAQDSKTRPKGIIS